MPNPISHKPVGLRNEFNFDNLPLREHIEPSVKPDTELEQDGYYWFTYDEENTGITLACMQDLTTGIVLASPISNPNDRSSARKAWGGIRLSRFAGAPWETYKEMVSNSIEPGSKLENIYIFWGHASAGDMANAQVEFYGIPMYIALANFHNSAINTGQERSTRYQMEFGGSEFFQIRPHLPELSLEEATEIEQKCIEIENLAKQMYKAATEKIIAKLETTFMPQNDRQKKNLISRALDASRGFLLMGNNTGMAYETTFRDWARLISEYKGSANPVLQRLGMQLEQFLGIDQEIEEKLGFLGEAPGLIRHTEPSEWANANLAELRIYLETKTNLREILTVKTEFRGEVPQTVHLLDERYAETNKVIAQYISTLYPGLEMEDILSWIEALSTEQIANIGGVILKGHNNHEELPLSTGTTGMTVVYETNLAVARDFNRQRAFGRHINIPLVHGAYISAEQVFQILRKGYTLSPYLTDIPEMSDLRGEISAMASMLYENVYALLNEVYDRYGDSINYSFALNILPLMQNVTLTMHGTPKQMVYMPHLRSRPGGEILYRIAAWETAEQIKQKYPFFSKGLDLGNKPNPRNREEFYDRD